LFTPSVSIRSFSSISRNTAKADCKATLISLVSLSESFLDIEGTEEEVVAEADDEEEEDEEEEDEDEEEEREGAEADAGAEEVDEDDLTVDEEAEEEEEEVEVEEEEEEEGVVGLVLGLVAEEVLGRVLLGEMTVLVVLR
jgi:phage repressor protein C with HTH and peptisase S24 domain